MANQTPLTMGEFSQSLASVRAVGPEEPEDYAPLPPPNPRPTDIEYLLKLTKSRACQGNTRNGELFGGCVRDMLNNEEISDYDIAVHDGIVASLHRRLVDCDRLISRQAEPNDGLSMYPVTKMVIDTPRNRNVRVDVVKFDTEMYNVCDFTCNNMVLSSGGLNYRVSLNDPQEDEAGRSGIGPRPKSIQTLAICTQDVITKTLRFMMPYEIPFKCKRAGRYDHSDDCKSCKEKKLLCQVKLVSRLLHMEKKGYRFPSSNHGDGAVEFPPYFPRTFYHNVPDILEHTDMDSDECPICYESLNEKGALKTKCGHRFCVDCLNTHLGAGRNLDFSNRDHQSECPMCRQSLELDSIGDESVKLYTRSMIGDGKEQRRRFSCFTEDACRPIIPLGCAPKKQEEDEEDEEATFFDYKGKHYAYTVDLTLYRIQNKDKGDEEYIVCGKWNPEENKPVFDDLVLT